MAKHTPGPWEAQRYSVTLSHASEAWHVCECHHGLGHDDHEALANAHLISATPELLEACVAQLALIDDMARFIGQMALKDYALFNEAPIKARRAISKATSS